MRSYTEEPGAEQFACPVLDWRRMEQSIRRPCGKKRPLGIQCWSDKLLQEVVRLILDAYFEPQFSPQSHGFRPERGCHTALRDIYYNWVGTVWFVEGDISKCFDALSHELLLSILRETIKDERFIGFISRLLKAGYLEDWRWNQTYSGTPQGSIVSPILANLYLDKLDKFGENVLIPEYTKGTKRKTNKAYEQLMHRASYLARTGRKEEARRVRKQAQKLPSQEPSDPDYRRLRYCRYADDVRHLTRYEILLSEKRGSEEMTSGSSHLPGRENGREKEHVRKAGSVRRR